jgi:signal transduction histidine kinase
VEALADDGSGALSPSPGLAEVDALVDTVRGTGLPVTLSVSGPPRALPPGLDGTAYRVVQEALTNVVKHARPASASVRITYRPAGLHVEVSDEGAGPGAETIAGESGGRGLQGMRYRVEACGGRLTVAAPEAGGFVVAARFPAPLHEVTGVLDRTST